MPLGAASRPGSSGENIVHFGPVRMRVNGTGNLILSYHSLQGVKSAVCPNPIVMQEITDIEPHRNMHLVTQRASLKIQTTEIDEYFRINRIIIYAKEVFTAHPR